MADQQQLLQNAEMSGQKEEEPTMVQSTPHYPLNTYPTGYSVLPSYPQDPYNHQGVQVMTTQPAATDPNVVTVSPDAPPERPNHGLAVGTLVFAIMTLFCSCGTSLLCSVPAIIFSSVALSQDHKVEQAKKLSIASLLFTVAFYICVAITVIIWVIIGATQAAAFRSALYDYDFHIPEIHHVDIPELDDVGDILNDATNDAIDSILG